MARVNTDLEKSENNKMVEEKSGKCKKSGKVKLLRDLGQVSSPEANDAKANFTQLCAQLCYLVYQVKNNKMQ